MKNKYCLFIIFFLGFITIEGCAAATRPIVGETAYLPLNEGVKDLSFLSPSEVEILEAVNKTRESVVLQARFSRSKSQGIVICRQRASRRVGPFEKPESYGRRRAQPPFRASTEVRYIEG